MKQLFDAIYLRLAGSALATNYVGTRLYPGKAPQGVTFPYAVYELLPSTTDWTFCADMKFEDCMIQFSLFSSDSEDAEVNGMFRDLKVLYDWCTLAIDDYTPLWMRREFYHLLHDIEAGIEAGVWQYIVQYGIFLEET